MTRYTLPLAVWHLGPSVGEVLMSIVRFSRGVCPLAVEFAGRDGCVPEYCYFHIVIRDALIFYGLRICEQSRLIANFPVAPGIYELVGQQWGD